VVRGGSWYSDALYCRSAFRFSYMPGVRLNSLGVRLLRLAQ
jgi:formylglycine-generating enzyme required for sulfatase activity